MPKTKKEKKTRRNQQRYPTSSNTSYQVGQVHFKQLESLTSEEGNVFPMGKQILGRYLHLVRTGEGVGTFTRRKAVEKVVAEVKGIWDEANVPSKSERKIWKMIDPMVESFVKLGQNRGKKDQKWYKEKEEKLAQTLEAVLDVKLEDEMIPVVEQATGIEYGEEEQALYEDQVGKSFNWKVGEVDKEWLAEHEEELQMLQGVEERRAERDAAEQNRREKWLAEKGDLFRYQSHDSSESEDEENGENENGERLEVDEGRKGKIPSDCQRPRVILTRNMKQRLDTGELDCFPKDFKVRDSYHHVKDSVYDFLISFMADASASSNQAIRAAKNFAKHILKVDWLTEEEAREQKAKAEKEGVELPEDFYLTVLPCRSSVEEMRRNYALAAEKSTAELLLGLGSGSSATHHGDSTTRSMTGKIFTLPLTVGNNLHLNLPVQKLSSERAEDVADVYQLSYDRMSVLTSQPSAAFFQAIDAFMTDSAAEMRNFIPILKERFESEHDPTRLECVLHTTLGFSNSALQVLSSLEQSIGPNNLYGSAKCHDANNVVKSTVNAILKFVSPQYAQKPYNLKAEFDALLHSKGKSNDSFSLRSHRFGALEKASIVAIYHWNDVKDLCERVENRNDLIIFLRTVMDCQFIHQMILALALVGLHIIEPFIELVQSSSHTDLLQRLPLLFVDLQNHEHFGRNSTQVSSCVLPTLRSAFHQVQEKGVYKKRWLEVLQTEIDLLDDAGLECVQNVLGLISFFNAKTLQRQRGSAYGFADSNGPKKDDVSAIPQDKAAKMPVTNLRAENEFGSIDILLGRLRTTSVRLVSDHRVLSTSGGMVYGSGLARSMGQYKSQIKALQTDFEEKQLQKKRDDVMAMEGKVESFAKRRLALLEACKQHEGPFSSPADVTNFVSRCEQDGVSEGERKKALKAEVMYARETLTKRPKTDDVFRIRDRTTNRDLTSSQFKENLVALFSNVLAVADVAEDVVKIAIEKAKGAVGIGYFSSDKVASQDASSAELDLPVAPCTPTSSMHSPNHSQEHMLFERVAFAFVNAAGEKDWCLAMVDSHSAGNFELSLFRPVPGRLGSKRVAFFPPDETHLVSATSSDILPIPVVVSESKLDKDLVFVVHNHEEIDMMLSVAKEMIQV